MALIIINQRRRSLLIDTSLKDLSKTKMKHGLLLCSPCHPSRLLSPVSTPFISFTYPATKHAQVQYISATIGANTQQQEQQLSARERRQMRNERRELKAGYNWREEVEERLLKKPKKRYASWTEELNLDNLVQLGPQWWVVRVSRVRYEEISERLAQALARNFPDIDFKMYAPVVQMRRKLKNDSYSVKPKPIFPGCVFLRCVLNKERHDFIRECDGVGGFVGSKVGNTKRQINKPRPVSADDMEAIFQEAKEEQRKADQAFEEEQQREETLKSEKANIESHTVSSAVTEYVTESQPKRRSRKASDINGSPPVKGNKSLVPGSTVRIVSGTFAEYVGSLKKLNRKTGKATVGFTLFGKYSLVHIDVGEIVPETT